MSMIEVSTEDLSNINNQTARITSEIIVDLSQFNLRKIHKD